MVGEPTIIPSWTCARCVYFLLSHCWNLHCSVQSKTALSSQLTAAPSQSTFSRSLLASSTFFMSCCLLPANAHIAIQDIKFGSTDANMASWRSWSPSWRGVASEKAWHPQTKWPSGLGAVFCIIPCSMFLALCATRACCPPLLLVFGEEGGHSWPVPVQLCLLRIPPTSCVLNLGQIMKDFPYNSSSFFFITNDIPVLLAFLLTWVPFRNFSVYLLTVSCF